MEALSILFIVGALIVVIKLLWREDDDTNPPPSHGRGPRKRRDRRPTSPWVAVPPQAPQPASAQPPPAQDPLRREKMFADVSSKASYTATPILHRREADLFQAVEDRVRPGGRWRLTQPVRVLAQVNLGEIVQIDRAAWGSPNFRTLAYSAINTKRVDLLIASDSWMPLVAIELQGWRHAVDDKTQLRDEAKRNALSSAGIRLVEVDAKATEQDYMRDIYYTLAEAAPHLFPAIRSRRTDAVAETRPS